MAQDDFMIDMSIFSSCCVPPRERRFDIKKVIFNNPATIVFWKDGTKTVVKCQGDEYYDKEKGLAMCFVKKIFDNKGSFNDKLNEWIDPDYRKKRRKEKREKKRREIS